MVKVTYYNDVNFDDIDLYSISTRSQEYYNSDLNTYGYDSFLTAKAHIWDNQTVKITGWPGDERGSDWISYPVSLIGLKTLIQRNIKKL